MEVDEPPTAVPPSNEDNFTPIQSRRFRRGTDFPCWSLCPSMDLIALGSRVDSGALDGGDCSGDDNRRGRDSVRVAESLAVHRILSWQTLLSLKAEQLSSSSGDDSEDGGIIGGGTDGICVEDIERRYGAAGNVINAAENSTDKADQMTIDNASAEEGQAKVGATSVCWSPDGRLLAVGLLDGGVLIHTVEPDSSGADGASSGDLGADGHGALRLVRPPPPSALSNLNSTRGASEGAAEESLAPSPVSDKRRNFAAFSPRVTRSMAAARGGAAGGVMKQQSQNNQPVEKQQPVPKAIPTVSASEGKELRASTNLTLRHPNAIIGMTWKKLSPGQLAQMMDDDQERELRESWRHAATLVNRGSHFLPPSSSLNSNSAAPGGRENLPSSTVQLSVLCVATTQEIHWYLQGQYRIMSIPHELALENAGGGMDLVCSPDLSTLLAVTKQSPIASSLTQQACKAKLYHIPLLPQKRFHLQLLSSMYTSIFSHLWDAKKGIAAALSNWKTALRPLDTKFKGLLQLLAKYQVDSTESNSSASNNAAGPNALRRELLRFILTGRSTISGTAPSALDQFFTRAHMHDQLLQREARGVEASVASMEGLLRSRVLNSIRALVYESGELYGLARSQTTNTTTDSPGDSIELMDAQTALILHVASRSLYITLDTCLTQVVLARSRLHDLLGWMRGTASQVRAWGTAADSIQRQNARSRRIANGVVQRVADFLSRPIMFASKHVTGVEEEGEKERMLTECVIGVPLSDFFGARDWDQPKMTTQEDKENSVQHGTQTIHNLNSFVHSIFRICTTLFDKPRSVFAESLMTLDIQFEAQHSVMATHARIGAGPTASCLQLRNDGSSGFFVPKTKDEDASTIERCPFWTLLARSIGATIEFIAIPDGHRCNSDSDADFYLRANLIIPEGCEVTNLVFYGDDGISSLTPNANNGSESKEGRQSLGCVLKRNDSLFGEAREELVVLGYDDMIFQKFDLTKNSAGEVTISSVGLSYEDCTYLLMMDDDEENHARNIIVPRRRLISTPGTNSRLEQQSQVNLCGSRGTGGVITFGESTSLNIFDLEENESEEDESMD